MPHRSAQFHELTRKIAATPTEKMNTSETAHATAKHLRVLNALDLCDSNKQISSTWHKRGNGRKIRDLCFPAGKDFCSAANVRSDRQR